MCMRYRIVSIEHLMEHEFAQVEGDINNISTKSLANIASNTLSPQALLTKLNNGEYLLLTDAPTSPLLLRTIQKNGQKAWCLNDVYSESAPSSVISGLTQRINMLGQSDGGNSVGSNSNGSRSNSGNLHPSPEMLYTPEPVKNDIS